MRINEGTRCIQVKSAISSNIKTLMLTSAISSNIKTPMLTKIRHIASTLTLKVIGIHQQRDSLRMAKRKTLNW